MKKFLAINFALFLFLAPVSVRAQLDGEKLSRFEAFVQKQMAADKAPGMTIGFIKDGKTWVKGFGYSDLENKIPAKPDSAYRLASITKPMTAIAILQLVEEGKIDLDAEVQNYVPYFPKKKYPVKVGLLLGHLGGISHYQDYDKEGRFKDHKNTREAIRVFEDFNLISEPGTRYNYSSYGYNLLGAVIEGASGKSYGDYMRDNVWEPLGMSATRMDDPNEIIPNRVRGYRLVDGKLINSEFVDVSSRFSAGGTRSTVIDLLKFAEGMSKGKLLSDSTREKMWTSMTTKNGRFTYYGMGWGRGTTTGHFMVSHSGSQAETRTILYVFPKMGFAVAAAMNFENANPGIYAEKLFELVNDTPWRIPVYASRKEDRSMIEAVRISFLYGMEYLERYGKAITDDPGELKESFADFNSALKLSDDEAARALQQGRNPAGNLTFLKMASFMASTLKANESQPDFERHFQNGAIEFFASYIKWYKANPKHPAEYRFAKDFEERVAIWKRDWAKTWTNETINLDINSSTDFKGLGDRLKELFSGKTVYPNYIGRLDNMVPELARTGNFDKAIEVGQVNNALYPDSEITNGTLGILYVAAGKTEEARDFFVKSNKINPRGTTNPGNMNSVAYDLNSIGLTEAGLKILLIAIEFSPKDANLYDSAGEFYLKLKQKDKAREYYSKALKIDPNYPNAAVAKKIIDEH